MFNNNNKNGAIHLHITICVTIPRKKITKEESHDTACQRATRATKHFSPFFSSTTRRKRRRREEGGEEKRRKCLAPSGGGSQDASGSQEVLSTTCVQLLVARLWRASRVEAVGVVCSLSRSSATPGPLTNLFQLTFSSLLPPQPYNTILLFCSMVLSGHRVQGVSWVSPVQVRDWTPFEAHLIDQVLMKMIRPPLWRFLYYRLLANDVHLVVHSSTETRYRAFRDYRPEQRLHAGPIRQTDGRYLQMIELGNYLAYAGNTVGT